MHAMEIIFVLLVAVLNFAYVGARIGVDLSASADVTSWKSYFPSTSKSTSFGIVHAQFYNNTMNSYASRTLKAAWKAGISDLSVYVHPCIPTSPFALNSAISCGSAEEQVDNLVSYFRQRGIEFRRYNVSTNLTIHDRNVPSWNTSATANVTLQTLFLNVEDSFPNYYFSYIRRDNVNFLLEFSLYAQEVLGIEIGIYTTLFDWYDILTDEYGDSNRVYFLGNGSTFTTANPFRRNKLWLPRFDSVNDLQFFRTFADWESVYIKQTSGGSTDDRRIGSDRICTDFVEDVTGSFSVYI